MWDCVRFFATRDVEVLLMVCGRKSQSANVKLDQVVEMIGLPAVTRFAAIADDTFSRNVERCVYG